MTINRFCSSGLQAIAIAAGAIATGSYDIVVAGGVESMTMVPMTGQQAVSASPEAMAKFPDVYTPMGITAENVAKKFSISRADQDAFALCEPAEGAAAREGGQVRRRDRPREGDALRGRQRSVDVRVPAATSWSAPDTTLEGLAALKPAFAKEGHGHRRERSPLSDGAAAALVMSKAKAEALGLKPLGYFRAFATVGVDPAIMGIGPIPAVRKLLAKTRLSVRDIDIFELNEAFASQAVYVQRTLEIPDEKLNVHGGAIALGHPLGCTGAKLAATALYELRRRGGRTPS